ncbi:MAG: hypothetical protein Q8Q56_02170 [Alphaproteobacteria bacterium]|nr:hypothetical protein [Alphaproteobacteria bacterium]
MRPHINSFWKNFLLLQLLIICYSLSQHVAAAAEEGPHNFFRHEVHGSQFQCVEHREAIDKSAFYSDILQQMDTIRDRIATDAGKKKVTPELTKLNIACFAFEFFDHAGNPILFPFFFGHPAACIEEDGAAGAEAADGGGAAGGAGGEEALLNQPHFFISGRLDKTKIDTAIEKGRIDINSLTYLPDPPTSLFYEYWDMYKKLFEKYNKLRPFFNPAVIFETVQNHETAIKTAFQLSLLERYWVDHCDKRRRGRDFVDRPQHVKTLLRVETERLRQRDTIGEVKIIKSNKKDKRFSDEDIFQHSEQLALARMERELEGFIRFLKRFMESQDPPTPVSSIGSIVLHVFSRNTVCARCSSSIVLDFTRDFRNKILKILFGREENIPFYIMAATKLPCDTTSRKSEGFDESVYRKIHDHPATGAIPLRLYDGPKDCSIMYQVCFEEGEERRKKRRRARSLIIGVPLLMLGFSCFSKSLKITT